MKKLFILPTLVIGMSLCGCQKVSENLGKGNYNLEDLMACLTDIEEKQNELSKKELSELEDVNSYQICTNFKIMLPGIDAMPQLADATEQEVYYYDAEKNIGRISTEAYASLEYFASYSDHYEFINGDYGYKTYDEYETNENEITSSSKYYKKTDVTDPEAKTSFANSIKNSFKEEYYDHVYSKSPASQVLGWYEDYTTENVIYSLQVNKLEEGTADFSVTFMFETNKVVGGNEYTHAYYHMDAKIDNYKNLYYNYCTRYSLDEFDSDTQMFDYEEALLAGSYEISSLDTELNPIDLTGFEDKTE